MKPTAPTLTTEWVPIASILFDPTVNTRATDHRAVKIIADNLDLDALGYPQISARQDGSCIVIDGMHRISALRLAGWNNGQQIECRVHRGLTHERECKLFDELNSQKPMTAVAKMLARIGAHESPDLEINAIVESFGLRIGVSKLDGQICAPNALYRVYSGGRFGKAKSEPTPELLRATLQLLTSSWGRNKHAFRADMLEGTGVFLARYGNDVEMGALIDRLTQMQGGPLRIVADGRSLSNLHNSLLSSGIAAKLVFIYNERRRTKKLADWWAS